MESAKQRRTDSVEAALRLADGLVVLDFVDLPDDDPRRERRFSERMACPNGHSLAHRLPVTTPPEIIRKVKQAPP